MSPKQRALYFLGLTKDQVEKNLPGTFSNVKDAIAAIDEIVAIFDDFYPPFLTSRYWKEVKEELIKLK